MKQIESGKKTQWLWSRLLQWIRGSPERPPEDDIRSDKTTLPIKRQTFCILPFIHLSIFPDGTSKLCCLACKKVEKDDFPMSLYQYSLHEIWHSEYMNNVRRRMTDGNEVDDCAACYKSEAISGDSYRIQSNARWLAKLQGTSNNFGHAGNRLDAPTELPVYYQLMTGNACNLKCRMCSPLFSSRIESDDVHSTWAQRLFEPQRLLDWDKQWVAIAPLAVQAVKVEGLHDVETYQNRLLRWTNGRAKWTLLTPPGVSCQALKVRLWGHHPKSHRFNVNVNGHRVHSGVLPREPWERTFDILHLCKNNRLVIEIASDTFMVRGDSRVLGIALEGMELSHQQSGPTEQRLQRVPAGLLPSDPWYKDAAWLRNHLLRRSEQIKSIYFTGGEPMLHKQVEYIVDQLVADGVAQNISLEMNSNGTVINARFLEKLSRFERVNIALSIDGYREVNDYIRFPSNWETVRQNLVFLHRFAPETIEVSVIIIIQAYNVLQITDLLRLLNSLDIHYSMEVASTPWVITVGVMPPEARALAVARLRQYSAACRSDKRENILALANTVEAAQDFCSKESLATFLRFTGDLDATRGQNFRKVCSELDCFIQDYLAR
jgi:MoaA/NifB/PqqE/SkfB family radical SAM enzyme